MTQSQMENRPIIPRSYLPNINSFGQAGEAAAIREIPVCISIEQYSLTVEEIIHETDFTTLGKSPKRMRRG